MDKYEWEAQGIPSGLMVAPIALAAAGISHEIWGLHWSVVGGVAVGLPTISSYIRIPWIRDRGKTAQERRWCKEGGSPTLRAIRHRGTTLSSTEKQEIHKWGEAMGLDIPTEVEEKKDPEGADEKWKVLWKHLRAEGMKDERVAWKNRRYGLARNGHASKWIGAGVALMAITASTIACGEKDGACGAGTYMPLLLNSGIAWWWIGIMTKGGLERADKAYTEAICSMKLSRK